MAKYLYKVAEVWQRDGYIIIISDIPAAGIDYRFKDLLDLRRPDGSTCQVQSETLIVDSHLPNPPLFISLSGKTVEDVPIGTEVWLVNDDILRPASKLHRKFERIEKPAEVQTIEPRSQHKTTPNVGFELKDNLL